MKLRMDKTLRFWVDVAADHIKRDHPDLTKPQLVAHILREYERGVIFRLGKLLGAKGPGLIFLIPIVDRMVRMDLRVVTIDIPRQEVMTRDNVPVSVDAVLYFRVIDPQAAVVKVENFLKATSLIAQTTLRSVLGQRTGRERRPYDPYSAHDTVRPPATDTARAARRRLDQQTQGGLGSPNLNAKRLTELDRLRARPNQGDLPVRALPSPRPPPR